MRPSLLSNGLLIFGWGRDGDGGADLGSVSFGSFLESDEIAPLMLRGFPKFGFRIAQSYVERLESRRNSDR